MSDTNDLNTISNKNNHNLVTEKNNLNSENSENKIDSSKKENVIKEEKTLISNIDNIKHKKKSWFIKVINFLLKKNVLNKLFIICFATLVFSYIYKINEAVSREALVYIGLILCVVICYVEILGIRDHLWIIEGSLPIQKKWRDMILNPTTLYKHKIKKIIVLIFASIIFSAIYKYNKFLDASRDTLAFIGIVLMVTVVYYETLAVRDEINIMIKAMRELNHKNKKKLKNS